MRQDAPVPPIQYIVEGGHRLAGTIEPSGNKNSAPVYYTHLTLPTILRV